MNGCIIIHIYKDEHAQTLLSVSLLQSHGLGICVYS